jgi:HPt (histidine-containing phosphotransfer) domain-containing protein
MVPDRMSVLTADIRAGAAAQDWAAVAKHAHAARGVSSNMRLQPMVDILYAIEQNAKDQSAEADNADLCDRLDGLTEELRSMLSGGTPA